MTTLTKRQQQVCDFIVQSIRSGRPPTYREIMTNLGISSINGALCHVNALAKKGYITVGDGSRSIRLTRQKECPLCGK